MLDRSSRHAREVAEIDLRCRAKAKGRGDESAVQVFMPSMGVRADEDWAIHTTWCSASGRTCECEF